MNKKYNDKDIIITNPGEAGALQWANAGWDALSSTNGVAVYYNPTTHEYATGLYPSDPHPYTGYVRLENGSTIYVTDGWPPTSSGGISKQEYESQTAEIDQLQQQIDNYKNTWTSPQDLADNYTPNSIVNSQYTPNSTVKKDYTPNSDVSANYTPNSTYDSLQSKYNTATKNLSTDNNTIQTDTTQINALETQIKGNQKVVSDANNQQSSLQTAVANAQGQVISAQNQINSLQQQIQKLKQENNTLSNKLSSANTKSSITVNSGTTVDTSPTILTVPIFQQFTTNYYLSGNTSNAYYAATMVKRLPSIIANVEVNLNAMLNGRLYERYTPGAVVFKGWGSLSPQVEEQTLYQCITECVEYRLITQQYVNLTNSYSGMVNGQNNYQTQNNNVIGLRQDIQAKLSLLGLYANVLLGKKVPKSTEYQIDHDGFNSINFGNLQQWYGLIQNTAWNFTKPISFQGGMSFQGQVTFNNDVTLRNSITVPTVNATSGTFSNSVSTSTFTANNLQLNITNTNIPYVTMLNGVNGTQPSVSFMVGSRAVDRYSSLGKISNSIPIVPGAPTVDDKGTQTAPNKVTVYHHGKSTTPDVNKWTAPMHTTTAVEINQVLPPTSASPLNTFDVYASTINLWGEQINTTGNWTFSGNTTLKNATIEGDLNLNTSTTPNFTNGLNVSGGSGVNISGPLTLTDNITQPDSDGTYPDGWTNVLGPTSIYSLNSPNGNISTLITSMYEWNSLNNTLTTSTFNVSEYLAQESSNNYTNSYIENTPWTNLTDQIGTVNARIINSYGGCNFLVEQVVYDMYDLSQASNIPGYMHPLGDGDAYVNLQTLFLHTFGNGDLTNGYSYQFNVDWNKDLGLQTPLSSGFRNVEVDSTRFTVYIAGYDIVEPTDYMNMRLENASYNGNPFPSGVIARMVRQQQTVNNTLFRFNISVPVAVDNRQPDDSMFLHGAIDISAGTVIPRYLICAFTIRYWMRLIGGTSTTTSSFSTPSPTPQAIPQIITPSSTASGGAPMPYEPLYITFQQQLASMKQNIESNNVSPTTAQLKQFISIVNQYNSLVKQGEQNSEAMNNLYNNTWKSFMSSINN